mmetsp:Transcript_59739/g.99100  ORF Transcript_59739/g.99100 Transcript_59739/m.99100 type:complete len:217 (+) Transcript_59739:358-1008(+)
MAAATSCQSTGFGYSAQMRADASQSVALIITLQLCWPRSFTCSQQRRSSAGLIWSARTSANSLGLSCATKRAASSSGVALPAVAPTPSIPIFLGANDSGFPVVMSIDWLVTPPLKPPPNPPPNPWLPAPPPLTKQSPPLTLIAGFFNFARQSGSAACAGRANDLWVAGVAADAASVVGVETGGLKAANVGAGGVGVVSFVAAGCSSREPCFKVKAG